MERYRKAMGFIADKLYQMQYWRMMIEHYRLVLLPVDVDNLLALGDRSQRLIDNFKRVQSLSCGMQLAQAAVNQDQAWECPLLVLQSFVTACDYLPHGSEVVDTFDGLDDEFPVVGLLHLAVR